MQRLLLLLQLLWLSPSTDLRAAERVQSWPAWQQRRVALDRVLVCEEFRIFYTLAGPDALSAENQVDSDADGMPDKIQNIARQLVTARQAYIKVLGLRPPLESPRYHDRVKFIEVNVWELPGKNGSAGDGIVNYHRPTDPPEGVEVLTIDLAAKPPSGNLSPAHELFHQFQNGYSQFKNAWYYEGMARWSEDLFRAGAGRRGSLPANEEERDALFKQSYDASRFWVALAQQTDLAGKVTIPPELSAVRYVGSGKPVIEDDLFFGAPWIKPLLEEFEHEDHLVSQEEKLDPLDWPEARQHSPQSNPRIWKAVLAVQMRLAPSAPPLPR
jgi:hypothetical protein